MLGNLMEQLAVELTERTEESVAQLHGAPDDRVEHRLGIGRRARDHTQDLAGRRLLLQRVGQSLLQSLA
ncbi:MAG TPA: hypothetical protein VNP53_07505, partial [Methylomirabilota bacterium]|nr:hypothetical protein [Methylomirabilota bacterium]